MLTKVLTPVDFLTRKQKKEYIMSGDVKVYSTGDAILNKAMNFEYIMQLPVEEAQRVVLEIAKVLSDPRASTEMNVPEYYFKKVRMALAIEKNKKGEIVSIGTPKDWPITIPGTYKNVEDKPVSFPEQTTMTKEVIKEAPIQITQPMQPVQPIQPTQITQPTQPIILPTVMELPAPGFILSLNGKFKGEELSRRLENIRVILANDEKTEFDIVLIFKELAKPIEKANNTKKQEEENQEERATN